jgi:hydroxymethylpyrimidine/phosphomethylpyrimidine kinase
MPPPVVLSIAGFDPSSGAGITADIKTACAHGCFATTCITALTVQTTERVFSVQAVNADLVRDTLFELVRDLPPAAVRIGMLGNDLIAEVVADFLETVRPPNVVLDPVLRSTSGAALLDARGESVLRERLLKLVDVITPNVEETAVLCGDSPGEIGLNWETKIVSLAARLHQLGCKSVVVTGGHLDQAADLLSTGSAGNPKIEWFWAPKIQSRATHGTGCAFAMAIACNLATGLDLSSSVREAKAYVRRAIETAAPLGRGFGPLNHLCK